MIFFQTEYERRGEVIVDFNDLLWNNCSMSEILNANFETNFLIPKYSNKTFLVAHNGSIENQNLKDIYHFV